MILITATSQTIENLAGEMVLLIERLARETPPPDDATREIALVPELIDLQGELIKIQ